VWCVLQCTAMFRLVERSGRQGNLESLIGLLFKKRGVSTKQGEQREKESEIQHDETAFILRRADAAVDYLWIVV